MAILQTINVPLLAVNDTILTVVDILGSNGDFVNKGDVVLIFETSKTTYEVTAEVSGYIKFYCEKDADYKVNSTVAEIYENESEISSHKGHTSYLDNAVVLVNPKTIQEIDLNNFVEAPLFSEKAKVKIKEYNLKETDFNGKSFVSEKNVLHVLGLQPQSMEIEKKYLPVNAASDIQKVELIPILRNKIKEIELLSSVQGTGLISTISIYVDTRGLFAHVNKSLFYFKNSLLPLIVYEVARLLGEYKELNAYYTREHIALFKNVNIGFAIDLDKGLKVLKIANANIKTFQEIEQEIFTLSEKYIDDKIVLDDLTDVTFTITDLSSEGVNSFIPLVNFMNSAILGVNANDLLLNRMNLNLTFDHRVTEGKQVARFLVDLRNRLESYASSNDFVTEDISCFICSKALTEDLSGIGFAKVITTKGKEAYVCQTCFKGF